MNANTEVQIRRMKEQSIGVEIEMNNITREKASQIAADFFETGEYEHTAYRNGYDTWSAWDGRTKRLTAFIYIMHEERKLGIPSLHYIRTCEEGYRNFGFDTKFLDAAYEISEKEVQQ